MTNELDINKRFKWLFINNKNILDINITDASELEVMAIFHRLSYYGSNVPAKGDSDPRILINLTNATFTLKSLRVVIAHSKVKTYFVRHSGYGAKSPIWITLLKLMSPYLKSKALIFKTREQALTYATGEL